MIKGVAIDAAQAQPTTLREKKIHHNRDIQPPFLGPEGRDITPHTRLGAVTANWRLSTLGAMGTHADCLWCADGGAGAVVANAPGASASVSDGDPHDTPACCKAAHRRREPYVPREARWRRRT